MERCAAISLFLLLAPAPAAAQRHPSFPECREPWFGGGVAKALTTDYVTPVDLSVSGQLPISPTWNARDEWGMPERRHVAARFTLGTVGWRDRFYDRTTQQLRTDSVRLSRLAGSLVRIACKPGGLAFSLGAGAGLYYYDFGRAGDGMGRSGVHATMGLAIPAGNEALITSNVEWHIVRGPARSGVMDRPDTHVLQVSIGFSWRLRPASD